MRLLSVILIHLLQLPMAVSAQAAEPLNTAKVELLLQREDIGHVLIDDVHGQVYFERIRPAGSTPVLQSYNFWRNQDARTHLYVVPLDGSQEARTLFSQSDEAGFVLAGGGRWSPDGRRLAIYRLQNGLMHPGVYEVDTCDVAFFDVNAPQTPRGSSFSWTSSASFAHQIETNRFPLSNWNIMGTRAEAAAREAGWRERQVTADPVGAGRYAIDQSPAETPTFVEVNIYSGDITTLVEPVRSEAVDADENEVAEAPVSPPNEQAELLAFTENGAVYRMDDYSTGSRLIYVPVEGQAKTVFSFNSHLAGTVPASAPLLIEHTDYEGNYAVSWLYLPPEASGDDSAQYPLVVIAYPGKTYDATPPTENDLYAGSIWTTPLSANTSVEVFAAQGYAVLLPSIKLGPNGGPGEPRTRIMSSLISALDGAIVTGHVDPERLVLSGHSYGGYGALAAAAQTDRFDAIIAMSVNSNLTSIYGQFTPGTRVNFADQIFFGQSRISSMETGQNRMGTPPWIDPQRYIRNSPLFFADQIGTPILIIHGDIDTATLMTQAEEMFTALRREDKDVLFVRYWGEGHIIQQPQNQRDMWQRIFAFLEDNGVTPGPREMEPIEASAPH